MVQPLFIQSYLLMLHVVMVALGGALGAAARYGTSLLVERFWDYPLPLGTWIVNFAGCLLIGALVPVLGRDGLPEQMQYLFIVGFLGSLTTFSTFSLETMVYLENGVGWHDLVNAAGGVLVGLLCVWIGLQVGHALVGDVPRMSMCRPLAYGCDGLSR